MPLYIVYLYFYTNCIIIIFQLFFLSLLLVLPIAFPPIPIRLLPQFSSSPFFFFFFLFSRLFFSLVFLGFFVAFRFAVCASNPPSGDVEVEYKTNERPKEKKKRKSVRRHYECRSAHIEHRVRRTRTHTHTQIVPNKSSSQSKTR